MRIRLLISLLLLLPIFLSAQEVLKGRVVKIADGDTFTLLVDEHEQVKIRLYGIDAPEKKQAFGNKSKEFLSTLIWGEDVSVVALYKDRYGRTVGKVSTPNFGDVNYEMIRSGYAWHYKKYSKDQKYADAETYARENKLGIWHDEKPMTPEEYRKMKRDHKCQQ